MDDMDDLERRLRSMAAPQRPDSSPRAGTGAALYTRARGKRFLKCGFALSLTLAVVVGGVGIFRATDGPTIATTHERAAPPGSTPPDMSHAPAVQQSCEDRQIGEGGIDGAWGIPSDWREHSMLVGALGFYDATLLANLPPEHFQKPWAKGRLLGTSFYTILEAKHTARLVLLPEQLDDVAFYNIKAESGPYFQLSDGSVEVNLAACPGQDTEFMLALIIGEPMCVDMDVYLDGSTVPERVSLSLGRGPDGCT